MLARTAVKVGLRQASCWRTEKRQSELDEKQQKRAIDLQFAKRLRQTVTFTRAVEIRQELTEQKQDTVPAAELRRGRRSLSVDLAEVYCMALANVLGRLFPGLLATENELH